MPAGNIDKDYWTKFLTKFKSPITGTSSIVIDTTPFSSGKNSFAFMITDKTRNLKMVGKIDKRVYEGRSSDDFETCENRMIS